MEPTRSERPARRAAGLIVLALVTFAALASVSAQNLECLNCDLELVVVEWNGSALPGTLVTGLFEVRNTGESTDSYRITATAENVSWPVSTDLEDGTTGDVAPGKGLFAQDDNEMSFRVALLIPEDAPAAGTTTIMVEAQSENDDSLSKSVTVEARARQTYGWNLDCTPLATAEKSKRTTVRLTATNLGNGRDRATVSYTAVEGLVVTDPQPFELAAGKQGEQLVEIGVGLRADDGIEDIRWDLRSKGDPNVLEQCVTAFEVAGGTPDPTDGGDGEDEESPPAGFPLVAVGLGLTLWLHRRRTG